MVIYMTTAEEIQQATNFMARMSREEINEWRIVATREEEAETRRRLNRGWVN